MEFWRLLLKLVNIWFHSYLDPISIRQNLRATTYNSPMVLCDEEEEILLKLTIPFSNSWNILDFINNL